MLEDNRSWYSNRIGTSSSSSSLGGTSALQASSPDHEDGGPPCLEEPPDDIGGTTVEDSDNEDVDLIATRHPDAVLTTLPLQRTMSRGLSQGDERCPHPEMSIRRTSESAGTTGSEDCRDSASGSTLRPSASDFAVNGGPTHQQQQSPSRTVVTTFHKPIPQ